LSSFSKSSDIAPDFGVGVKKTAHSFPLWGLADRHNLCRPLALPRWQMGKSLLREHCQSSIYWKVCALIETGANFWHGRTHNGSGSSLFVNYLVMIFMGGFCFGQVNILVVDMSHFKEIPISEHFSILISDNQSEL
jgi:hypothetical protein